MMKLSEAIRKGIGISKKAIGRYHSPNKSERCVLGAACFGAYGYDYGDRPDDSPLMGRLLQRTTGINVHMFVPKEIIPEEVEKFTPRQLWDVIVALNDFTDWTREQIADWLEKEGF